MGVCALFNRWQGREISSLFSRHFLVQPAFLLPATIHPESLLQHKRLSVVKCVSVNPKEQFHNKGSSCTSDSA